jgi:hypothetical protein
MRLIGADDGATLKRLKTVPVGNNDPLQVISVIAPGARVPKGTGVAGEQAACDGLDEIAMSTALAKIEFKVGSKPNPATLQMAECCLADFLRRIPNLALPKTDALGLINSSLR